MKPAAPCSVSAAATTAALCRSRWTWRPWRWRCIVNAGAATPVSPTITWTGIGGLLEISPTLTQRRHTTPTRRSHDPANPALVQETGFGVESEPWDPSQSATEARIKKAKAFCDAQGVDLVLHMSGKGVPWRSDDIPTWDYSRFAAIVGDTFPNLIQTQRDFQSAHESGNDRVVKAANLVEAQVPSWLLQVTLTASEVNGITHNRLGDDPAKAALALLKDARTAFPGLVGCSYWALDAGKPLADLLAATKGWTVP